MNIFIFVYRFRSNGRYGFGIRSNAIVSGQGTFEQILNSIFTEVAWQNFGNPTVSLITGVGDKQFDVIWNKMNDDFEPVSEREREKVVEIIKNALLVS